MYQSYWNLDCSPFDNGAHPDFFFRSQSHQAALLKMRYVVENNQGAGLIAGGAGYGKTLLAELLPHELSEEFGPVVHLVFPQLSPAELLSWFAVELGADENAVGSQDVGLDRTIRQIETQLKAFSERGRHPILVVDEAHLIEDQRVFQALQLLLNFQTQPDTPFTLFFLGERTLLSRISRMAQLNDRLAVKSILQPLTHEETDRYIVHRLETAGSRQPVFDRSAVDAIFELSGGVPRRINRICDLALLVGYADGLSELSNTQIEAVSAELTAAVPD